MAESDSMAETPGYKQSNVIIVAIWAYRSHRYMRHHSQIIFIFFLCKSSLGHHKSETFISIQSNAFCIQWFSGHRKVIESNKSGQLCGFDKYEVRALRSNDVSFPFTHTRWLLALIAASFLPQTTFSNGIFNSMLSELKDRKRKTRSFLLRSMNICGC